MINIVTKYFTDGNPSSGYPPNEPHIVTHDKCCVFTHTREDCWWDRIYCTYRVKCPVCNVELDIGNIYEE